MEKIDKSKETKTISAKTNLEEERNNDI